ncbi:DUF1002 domain-containing protein [Miniphocaeibacter massiliensis]|uniref:DUF1002 domain-containing protein n=1 Tax=Miniphocaeibacter massiliensis TaxID=2041841 RepID=UPI000C1C5C06|nr:DUF1002 domain-containing protein [Miniphocaeibacter massiliensis]
MNKLLKKMSTIFMAGTIVLSSSATVFANEIDTKVINEKWGKPTFVYGESLNKSQIKETMKLVGIEDEDNVNSVKVTHKELVKYIGGDINNPSNMISSVLVTKENEGKGVNVVIKTPKNITQITSEQYANACLTAGVEDATVLVGAVRPVTGESALTGVYKAFEANGVELDEDRMEVAQDEIDTVNEISQGNKSNKDFSASDLNNAVTEIKTDLSEISEKQDRTPTLEEIRKVVEESLEKYDLKNIVTKDQIDKLISYFEKYVNTDALNSEQVKEQLGKWKEAIVDGATDLYDKAEESGILDKIAGFFRDVYEGIVGLFN